MMQNDRVRITFNVPRRIKIRIMKLKEEEQLTGKEILERALVHKPFIEAVREQKRKVNKQIERNLNGY